jgi:hypothetical protein
VGFEPDTYGLLFWQCESAGGIAVPTTDGLECVACATTPSSCDDGFPPANCTVGPDAYCAANQCSSGDTFTAEANGGERAGQVPVGISKCNAGAEPAQGVGWVCRTSAGVAQPSNSLCSLCAAGLTFSVGGMPAPPAHAPASAVTFSANARWPLMPCASE